MQLPDRSRTSEEAARIRTVYAHYDRTASEQRKRDKLNPGNTYIAIERERNLRTLLESRLDSPLSQCRILDVGCGKAELLHQFHRSGVPAQNLYGIDLLPDRIETNRKLYPYFHLHCANAEALDFPADWFDLIVCSTLFSSILDPAMARNVARSVARVLRPGGAVVWYDLRYCNAWNRYVRAITKDDTGELFPDFTMGLRTVTVIPSLARRLGRLTGVLYPVFVAVPLFRTYYLGLLLKPPTEPARPRPAT